jgi:citrate synthase
MNNTNSLHTSGLDDVRVADTRLSDVDGAAGRLIIAGRDVERAGGRDLAGFAAALWDAPVEEVRDALARGRVEAAAALPSVAAALAQDDGMDAIRSALSLLPPRFDDPARLSAATGVFAAAWIRGRAGVAPLAPDPSLDHAADLLRMCRGAAAPAAQCLALDTYLRTVSDHGMNASTFTARVVASTGADLRASVVAALGALKGPLHGGAPGPVLDMLDAIADPARATAWLEAELAAGRRIMGMGHRIYRVRDPRAAVFEAALEALEASGLRSDRLALARAVERAAEGVLRARRPDRPLHANVEFYTAVLLDALGLPREGFTPLFAAGRVFGWCAHVAEQRAHGRLIRPASRYVGAAPA